MILINRLIPKGIHLTIPHFHFQVDSRCRFSILYGIRTTKTMAFLAPSVQYQATTTTTGSLQRHQKTLHCNATLVCEPPPYRLECPSTQDSFGKGINSHTLCENGRRHPLGSSTTSCNRAINVKRPDEQLVAGEDFT